MEQTPIDVTCLVEPAPRPALRVLLATTWDTACGVAEHAFYLKHAVEAADPKIEMVPVPGALDPDRVDHTRGGTWDLLHLNYHAALHSRWTADRILDARSSGVYKGVITTYHDSGVPNSQQCLDVVRASNAAVLHEPFNEFGENPDVYYWRMGVPEWYGHEAPLPYTMNPRTRPFLGTVGFPFPWKCYDELCRVTSKVGWGLWIIAPGATDDQVQRWVRLSPFVHVTREFTDRQVVISSLNACDATAFTYVCHNTGQSGAILQGIAAKRPVIALETCRQFRALLDDDLGSCAIHWCQTFEHVAETLRWLPLTRLDSAIVQLAHQDRWSEVGKRYASLYRRVAARP